MMLFWILAASGLALFGAGLTLCLIDAERVLPPLWWLVPGLLMSVGLLLGAAARQRRPGARVRQLRRGSVATATREAEADG